MKSRCTDEQVFEGDDVSNSCLFALNTSSQPSDLYRNWMNDQTLKDSLYKKSPLFLICLRPGSIDTVGKLHNGEG